MVIKSFYDTIARIRNASNYKLRYTKVRSSTFTFNVLKILYELGFIAGFKILDFKFILVFLRYFNQFSSFRSLSIISKPSNYIYVSFKQLKFYNFYKYNFNSFFLISTHFGLLTDKQCLSLGIGGKLILEIF